MLFSHSVMSDCLWHHGPQHTRLPYPSLFPGVSSNSFPLSWWCHTRSHPLSPPSLPTLSSVQFNRSVVSDSLWSRGLQQARPPCPLPTPRVYSDSCPLSWWCCPTISSSVVLLLLPSILLQIRVFSHESAPCIRWTSIGASASASVFPMNI